MEDLRLMVARIDENVKHLKETVTPLVEAVRINTKDIIVIKNDKKWAIGVFGALGVILGTIVEFFRK